MAPDSARVKDRKTFRPVRCVWEVRSSVRCRASRGLSARKTFAPGKPAAAPSLTRKESDTRTSAMPPHSRGGQSNIWRQDHGLRSSEHLRDHRTFRPDGERRRAADPAGRHPEGQHHPRDASRPCSASFAAPGSRPRSSRSRTGSRPSCSAARSHWPRNWTAPPTRSAPSRNVTTDRRSPRPPWKRRRPASCSCGRSSAPSRR